MSKTHISTFIIICFMISCCYSCSINKEIKTEPILYQTDFEVQYRVVHMGSDSSALQLVVESDDYELSYQAYSPLDKKIILAEEILNISNKKSIVAERKFKIREPAYYLEISIRDNNGNRQFKDIVKVDKNSGMGHLKILSDGKPLVRSYIKSKTEVNLSHTYQSTIWVKYFDRSFKSAAPPFSDKGYKFNPKKNITELVEVPSGSTIKLEGEGLYFIQSDTSTLGGFYLNVFPDRYPRISSANQMIESTRYIMKTEEYKALSSTDAKKDAIDKFWMGRARDKEFAKELIKTYYTRVQIANRDFTTYKEGWKTDKGMLYLIFGVPDLIRKTKQGEIWSYGSSGKRNAVKFEFKKVNGQSLLLHSDFFKRPWDVEIYEWRKGILNE
jgi:GWxTD domain-containing protein